MARGSGGNFYGGITRASVNDVKTKENILPPSLNAPAPDNLTPRAQILMHPLEIFSAERESWDYVLGPILTQWHDWLSGLPAGLAVKTSSAQDEIIWEDVNRLLCPNRPQLYSDEEYVEIVFEILEWYADYLAKWTTPEWMQELQETIQKRFYNPEKILKQEDLASDDRNRIQADVRRLDNLEILMRVCLGMEILASGLQKDRKDLLVKELHRRYRWSGPQENIKVHSEQGMVSYVLQFDWNNGNLKDYREALGKRISQGF